MRRLADLFLVLGVGVSLLLAGLTHARFRGDYDFLRRVSINGYIVYAIVLILVAYSAGLPEIPRTFAGAVATAAAAGLASAAIVSIIQAVTVPFLLPRFVVLLTPIVLIPVQVGCWQLAQLGDQRRRAAERVLVVARPEEAEELRLDIDIAPERLATIVEVLDPADPLVRSRSSTALMDTARAMEATLLVLSEGAQDDEEIVRQAAVLHEQGVRVRTLTAFYDEWLGKLPIAELGRVSLMFDIGDIHQPVYTRTKRLIDLTLAIAVLPVLAVMVPVVLVGNLMAGRGPLMFRQVRVGYGGKPFTMLKFRTMIPSAATADGAGDWTSANDPRVTRFGHLMRRAHLDELPQAINVLRGDLSIVGPRPEQPQYVKALSEKLPFYGMRHVVRPGITGWAQVKWWYASNEIDTYQKLQYELFYLRHQSLALDAKICARTVRHVLLGWGR